MSGPSLWRVPSKLRSEKVGRKPQQCWQSREALSLVAGASMTAVGPAGQKPMENTAPVIALGEEEISDFRVAIFQVFDDAGKHAPRLQLVKERRHRSGRSSTGAVYGGSAIYGGGGGYGRGGGPTGAGGPDGM
jgi:hypothetical protein